MSSAALLELARNQDIQFVDLVYAPFIGPPRHQTVPVNALTPAAFEQGIARINPLSGQRELLKPDPSTGVLDPFYQHPTLRVLCDLLDGEVGGPSRIDTRGFVQRAVQTFCGSNDVDAVHFAPQVEFFLFDQACFDQSTNGAHYLVDSREGAWRRGRQEPDNLGLQIESSAGLGQLPPRDAFANIRSEIAALVAERAPVVSHAHGIATGGQVILQLAPLPPLAAADAVEWVKYVARNVAARHGKVATFMPKPLVDVTGSGMPVQIQVTGGGKSLLRRKNSTEMVQAGRALVGGLLQNAEALVAVTCPTTNSYRRLHAGDAPTTIGYSAAPDRAIVWCPPDGAGEACDWVRFEAIDPACNPYFAFGALLLAMHDGLTTDADPGAPVETPAEDVPEDEWDQLAFLPTSLEAALEALGAGGLFLGREGALPEDVLEAWIQHKFISECNAVSMRPHPHEFTLYFNI